MNSLVYDSNLNALYVGFAATYLRPATIDVVSPSTMAYDDLSWTGIDATGVSSMTLNGSDLFAGSQDITGVNEIDISTMATIMDWTPLNAVLQYQPNTIIQGTDLPNLDDGTHATDGVITWGTALSGITTTFGGFMPVTTATAPVGGGGGNPTSQYSSGMPPLTSEGNFSNIPGSGVIDPVLTSSDIPLDLFWDILIFAGILGTRLCYHGLDKANLDSRRGLLGRLRDLLLQHE